MVCQSASWVQILGEADVDHADNSSRTPLFAAASMGHADVVSLLLFWGAYVDSIDAEGRTVLAIAATQGSVEVVRQLLDRGLDELHRDNAGWTPLHYAALEGHAEVGRLLAPLVLPQDSTKDCGPWSFVVMAYERVVHGPQRLDVIVLIAVS